MPIKIKGKDPQPPKPATTTTTTPAPKPVKASAPSGAIATAGFSGVKWDAVTQYDDAIHAAADPVGWPIERVRGHILIESLGNPKAIQQNASNGYSYGLMQVVPYGVGWEGWHKLVKDKAGLAANASKQQVIDALYNPAINIAVGVAILEGFYEQHGTLDKASSAFFLGNPNWKGEDTVNGNTGTWYRNTLNALIKEQDANGTTPAVTTTPAPKPIDPISVIVGGVGYPPIDYGFGSDVGLKYYTYGIGHGLGGNGTQHTGYDVSVPCGTRLYTPIDGVVDCVGNRGTPRWGQGCGAYADVDGGGVGNITIMGDSGHKLTLGHCRTATVQPGQRVVAGQQVGTVGSMNGCHVHCEVSVLKNGSYWLVDPGPALIQAMGGKAPVTYVERLPIPQPDDDPPYWVVRVVTDEVPVLQSGSAKAPKVAPPLKKGETFFATYRLPGTDGKGYWVSTKLGRVPISGTEEVEVVLP